MQSIATLAYTAFEQPAPDPGAEYREAIKQLFLLMQGSYGNLFLTKFGTGVLDDENRDLGIRAAMAVWRAQLSKYSAGVIVEAANRMTQDHPEYPPNLPQFQALCRALTPVKTHPELAGWNLLPPPKLERVHVSIEAVGDGKDQFRKIWARYLAGDKTLTRFTVEAAIEVLGAEAKAMKQERGQ